MIIRIVFPLIFCLSLYSSAKAQSSKTNYILQEKMKLAVNYMSDSNYNAANNAFRNILKTEKVLPKNFSYYFSETLYHLGQYENSHNFLEKYLTLNGKRGDFFKEAEYLEELLDKQINKISHCRLCDVRGYLFTTCSLCDGDKTALVDCHKCKAIGVVNCKKCKGEGVVITTNTLGDNVYKSCDRCESKGSHYCDLCNGTKQILSPCRLCLGSGMEATSTLCTHKSL